MKSFISLVVFLFAFASVKAEADTRNHHINQIITKALEFFREGMSSGWPMFGIPPLDPLEVPEVEFDFNEGYASMKGMVNNTVVAKLSTFEIENVASNVIVMAAKVWLTLEEVEIFGDYELEGIILNTYNVEGKGPFKIIGKGIKFSVDVDLDMTTCNFVPVLQISELEIDLTLEETEVEFTGIHTEDMSSDDINNALSKFGPDLFKAFTDRYIPIIEKKIIDTINHILGNLNPTLK